MANENGRNLEQMKENTPQDERQTGRVLQFPRPKDSSTSIMPVVRAKWTIVEAVRQGATLSIAARQAGVDRQTIHAWAEQDHLFASQLRSAEQDRIAGIEAEWEEMRRAAVATLTEALRTPYPKVSPSMKLRIANTLLRLETKRSMDSAIYGRRNLRNAPPEHPDAA